MSRFHKPRPSHAILCALFYANYSFASPLVLVKALNPDPSIVSASQPVRIVPAEDLPADWIPPSGGPPTINFTDGGATEVITYNIPRDLAQGKQEGTASEPVNVITGDRISPELRNTMSGI